jgi:uncharacterized protein (TIGR02145 family)
MNSHFERNRKMPRKSVLLLLFAVGLAGCVEPPPDAELPPDEEAWACSDATAYHGVAYATVQIGEQCWFAENLRTTAYANGEPIQTGLADADWNTTTEGATSVYGDGLSTVSDGSEQDPVLNEDRFGRLYNWFSVVDERGLCPGGWHVPSPDAWMELADALGGLDEAGNRLKATGTIEAGDGLWQGPNEATNESGFSALPGGLRSSVVFYAGLGTQTDWWTNQRSGEEGQPGSEFATSFFLTHDYAPLLESYGMLEWGFSVRCLKD